MALCTNLCTYRNDSLIQNQNVDIFLLVEIGLFLKEEENVLFM